MSQSACLRVLLAKISIVIDHRSRRPASIKAHSFSSLPSDTTHIARSLLAIFTRRPFTPDDPQLADLAPSLSTRVVESVLHELKSWKIALKFFTWASNQNGYAHNCYTYNAMACMLSRARQNAALRALAVQAVDTRCKMTPGALGYFIRCLGSVGMVEEANVMFDKVKQLGLCVPNSYSYNCLLEVIAKSDAIELAEMRLKEMRDLGWDLDKYTLTSVLQIYCNSLKLDVALKIFDEMYGRGWVDPHVCSVLLLPFSKCGEVDQAFELVESMEGRNLRLNEKTFCVLIHGFVRASRLDRALQLFDKLRKSGISPDIALYDVLIEGLCKNNDLEDAFKLYLDMSEYGIVPDVNLLNKLTSYFSEEGELTQLLKEIPKDVDTAAKTLVCNSVLSFYVKNGEVVKAYHLLRGMMGHCSVDDLNVNQLLKTGERFYPDTTSFTIVINGLLKDGQTETSLSLFNEMVRIGCRRTVLLYNNLISNLCDLNRLEEANELLQEMKDAGFEPTEFTCNCIYGCLCRREDVLGALNCVKEMRLHGQEPWIKHSTQLIKQLCDHGRVLEGCEFLKNMVTEGFLPDIVAYSAALNGLIKIRAVDQALELFRGLCARGCQPDVVAYNILINGLCKAKRVPEAHDMLNEMVRNGLVPSVVTYNLLIDGWCKTNTVDQAMLCLSRMYEVETKPNVISYTSLIDGLCNARKPDDALTLWNDMLSKGCAPNRITYMALIHGLCKCDRLNEALEYLRQIQEKEMKPDTFVYASLLRALLSDQNLSAALEMLKDLVKEGKFPCSQDRNYPIFKNAIIQMSQDAVTSSTIRDLVEAGSIPPSIVLNSGTETELNPGASESLS
ncbi:putative pentatricopeptide repeat-containing protein At5g08310, mitochondrial [Rhodamnia argentea]|uniref:Pentatricopeptide repeat-containing protein At5g08310, mitochondrial n=1 Tax=Rhodamnia argentea TaxID=178133 RepID=A0A8B8NXQ3_9MYRT|nr:putative pentatricopeptide repeat-containing protein At5g08310, mitochondrial [Rhodamnia argentea]